MAGDSDFDIIIGLLVDGDDPKTAASLREAMQKTVAHLESETKTGEEKVGRARRKAAEGEHKKYAKEADAATERLFKSKQDAERKLSAAGLAALKFYLKERNQILQHGRRDEERAAEHFDKERRRANRTTDFRGLADQKSVQKIRLANEAASLRRGEAEARAAERVRLEGIRRAGRSQYVAEQASQARRTALFKSFLRAGNRTYESALRGTQGLVTSYLRRRETSHRETEKRITAATSTAASQRTATIRHSLETENSVYSRAASRRLANIEAAAAKETKVIRRSAVKQAEAVAAIQTQTQTGLLGAATAGRGLGAGGLIGILAGAGGGRYTYNVLADFQSIETTFRGIFDEVNGKAPRTEAFLDDMRDFAKETPYTLRTLSSYAQKFFANGLVDPNASDAVADLTDKLTKLADAGSATGKTADQIDGAVLGLTQISASGRLSLEDLRQVTEGIGLRLSDVAAELGMTTGELFTSLEKGEVDSVRGLEAIFNAMEKIPGAAGASARQAKTLRGAFSNLQDVIDGLIVKYLAPLGVLLAKLVGGFASFISKLAEGQGVYKIVRDGLTGIAIALGAIIAAKGAVQVLKLTNGVLSLIAANPGVAVLVALGAAAGILYKNVPGISSFFDALVDGTSAWWAVGYKLGEPLTNLSKIVELQTTFGAAGRAIHDGFMDITSGIKSFIDGDGTGELQTALYDFRTNIVKALTPAKNTLADGLRVVVRKAQDYLATVRINLGAFLLTALGVTGGDGGIISRFLHSFITKGILGGIASVDGGVGAAELGTKLNDIAKGAIEYAKNAGVDIAHFFTGLFTGNVNVGDTANNLGVQLRWWIEDGLAKIGGLTEPVREVFGKIASKAGDFFTKSIVPKLIEIPRIIGRFLSRTLFSEGFLKALAATGAALGAAAIVIAGQFLRGFLEGIWQRRGDIVSALFDILTFAVKTVLGSGNPLILLGGALVAVFAGVKVANAISTLRGNFAVAAAAMKGDLEGVAAAKDRLAKDPSMKDTGPGGRAARAGAGLGTLGRVGGRAVDFAAIGIYEGAGKAEKAVKTLGAAARDASAKASLGFYTAGSKVADFGDKILGTTGLTVDAYGRLRTASGTYAKDVTKDLSTIRRTAGQTFVRAGEAIRDLPAAARSASTKVADSFKSGYAKVKGYGEQAHAYQKENFSKTQAAAQAAFGLMSGYALGYSDSVVGAAASATGALGGIAVAFASPGGPILGPLAILSTGIGAVVGYAKKESDKAKAEAAAVADAVKVEQDRIASSFQSTFKDLESTGPEARAAAGIEAFKAAISDGSEGAEEFSTRFGGSIREAARASAIGEEALRDYTDSLKENRIAAILDGDTIALGDFSEAVTTAGEKAAEALSQSALDTALKMPEDMGRDYVELIDSVQALTGDLAAGRLTRQEYIDQLTAAGVAQEDVNAAVSAFDEAVRTGVMNDPSATGFLDGLATKLGEQIDLYEAYADAQAEAQRRLDLFGPVADRVSSAFDRIKGAIDKTADAYRDWLDIQSGKQLTAAQGAVNLLSGADSFNAIDASTYQGQKEREIAVLQAKSDFGDQVASLAQDATSVEDLKAKVQAYVDEIRDNATPAQQDFINLVTALPSNGALESLLSARPQIESVLDLKQKISDYLATHPESDLAIKLNTGTEQEQQEAILQIIDELNKTDPTVSLALGDAEFREQVREAELKLDDFVDESATKYLGVDIVPGEGYAEFLEIYRSAQAGTLPTTDSRRYNNRPEREPGYGYNPPAQPTGNGTNTGGQHAPPELNAGVPGPVRINLPSTAPDVESPGSSLFPNAQPGDHLTLQQTIVETTSPRLTALESVRQVRAGQFLGGQSFGHQRPPLTGGRPSPFKAPVGFAP